MRSIVIQQQAQLYSDVKFSYILMLDFFVMNVVPISHERVLIAVTDLGYLISLKN